jgi:DNA-binding transcriptional MerR regulator
MDGIYTIGQLAEEFGVSNRTLRFYEEKGLLAPLRSDGGARHFSERDRDALKAIRQGKALGFTLEEISGMEHENGELKLDPDMIDRQIGHLEIRAEETSNAIRDLVRMADTLQEAA